VQQRLTELWYREHSPAALLEPLAALYGAVVGARRRLYAAGWKRAHEAGKPVVVVGNLTVGGTGKTPLTVWLAQALTAAGLRVGIVSRGYGRRGHEMQRVTPDSDWRDVGDEPLLLARRTGCPTVVGADRLAAARSVAPEVEVILCDDGLQHLQLARDFAIVVVDGTRGFGNRRLLPAGPLREPLSGLARADAVVVNGELQHPSLGLLAQREPFILQLAMSQALPLAAPQSPRALAAFAPEAVHAVAGIGNPARFFAALRAHGLTLIEHAFPDHHAFEAAQLDFADGLPVLMTEKDAVKCTAFANPRLWYVPVSAQFEPSAGRALLARVLGRLGGGTPGG
jgi:tetraacyldisaccharide 4'-kinase